MARSSKKISIPITYTSAPQGGFGYVRYEAGGTYGPVQQRSYQLVGLVEGQAEIHTSEESFLIPVDHIGLLKPGREIHITFTREAITLHNWLHQEVDAFSPASQEELNRAPDVLPYSPRLRQLMELGLQTSGTNTRAGEELMRHLAPCLFHEYLRGAKPAPKGEQRLPESLTKTMQWVRHNLAHLHHLEELARVAHVSPNHLIKLFREHLGVPPLRWCNQERTNHASVLLDTTGLTVAQIADQCGFSNPYHFSRVFRQYQGLSPRAYRQKRWNQAPKTVS